MEYLNAYSSTETLKLLLDAPRPKPLYPQGPAARVVSRCRLPDPLCQDIQVLMNLSLEVNHLPDEQPDTFVIANREVCYYANTKLGRADVVTPCWTSGREERDGAGCIVVRALEHWFDPNQWECVPTDQQVQALEETPC